MVVMTRHLNADLLQRLAEQRHQLIRTGSFGDSYSATLDAYRLAQEAQEGERVKPDFDSRADKGIDYRALE